MRLLTLVPSLLLFAALATQASDIGVVGLFPGKAVLIIDGSAPKTFSVGSKVTDDVKLVDANGSTATLEIKGKRQVIGIGDYVSRSAPGANSSVIPKVNPQGNFVAQAQINGNIITMLVDTGVTMIALPASEATRLGVDYKKGQKMTLGSNANGAARVYRVKLNGQSGRYRHESGRCAGTGRSAAVRTARHVLPEPRRDASRGRDDGTDQAVWN